MNEINHQRNDLPQIIYKNFNFFQKEQSNKNTALTIVLLAVTAIPVITTTAKASQAGDCLVRGRNIHVNPHDSSGYLFVTPGLINSNDTVAVSA
jgi:hypothetical protein